MNETDRSPLFAPLRSLPRVNGDRERQLNRLGLYRTLDLLFYFPREYRQRPRFTRIADLQPDIEQTTYGRLIEVRRHPTRRFVITSACMEDDWGDQVKLVWFNQPNWMFQQMRSGRRALVTGKPSLKNRELQFAHPGIVWLDDSDETPEEIDEELSPPPIGTPVQDDTLYPVYSLTEGLKQYQLHQLVKEALETLPDLLDDVFPEEYREKHRLLPIAEAIRKIHLPRDFDEAELARRRFIYQEFLLLQLALSIRRQQHEIGLKAPTLPSSPQLETRIRQLMPYDLTGAQNRVIKEIAADMEKPVPMNRLLQGDVGSGKTLVAAAAMLQSAAAGYQSVLMAPTEVLARQHFRFLKRLLENSKVSVVSLLGGQRPKERSEILWEIENGTAGIVVGTQAIVCNEIKFHKLGLVVIDEQHKFGVRQRARLKTGTDTDPHYLVMTATPIPRSMTMTAFGDLDISILDELPPGRQPVRTFVVDEEKRERWWAFFRQKIEQGRQGYVVVPRVDETDDGLKNVQAVRAELAAGPLAGIRLGVIHGRMTPEEKDEIMADFRSREIEVLIATSVIEVGIDVPNATMMTIENANMFGLAQLHQLRGRIGRGKYPGFCGVLATADDSEEEEVEETPKPARSKTRSGAARLRNDPDARLAVFASSTDGFFLAEKDFEMRGPGDLFGTDQHGLCHFRIADILRDKSILEEARADAAALVKADPGLASAEHHALRRQVLTRYGKALDLGDVG